ncbi:MAG: hypothetical protein DME34_04045 [Verrucomicrobia bacterium]|nr:MAG: hypothetical protein DME34_04045 [Verrucomicrobiota bacterium]
MVGVHVSSRLFFARLTALFCTSKISFSMRLQTISEARWIIAILACVAIASWFVSAWLALLFVALIVGTILFFRDPDRHVPADPNAIVAAADGTVTEISEIEESPFLKTKTRRIGIFLSIFDVHTNRAPIDGRVIYRQHREGLCLDARRFDCSEAWAEVGDDLKKGDRFGMIRFGSRTEVYLPLTATVLVKVGDHVSAGSTIIARWPDV